MQCKRCGARLQQGMLICPECGARQGRLPESVRCASCHGRVPIGLTVCPHCGRTVRPAGPRWGLWALFAGAIVLVALWGLGKLPVERVRREIADTRDRLSGLVQVLDVPTALPPTPTTARVAAARTATPALSLTITATQTVTMTLPEPEGFEQQVTEAITATWTVTPTLALATAAVVTPTVSTTPAVTQPAPTQTPTPTATATSTPAAKVSPAPTKASGSTYVVKSGDTLAGIAAQYGIAWQDIAAANNITAAAGLQVGQILRIPVAGAPVAPTATPRPKVTPTTSAAPATTSPALSAPILENPSDGSRADGETAEIELRWQPVPGMPDGGLYQVTVEYMEGGQKKVVPLPPTASTGQRFPPWLYKAADLPGRQYTWYVTVVRMATDGKGGELAVPLSPPSIPSAFGWQ
jgi:LysM repeat protein